MYFQVPTLLLSSRMEVGKKVAEVYERDGGGRSGQRALFHNSWHVLRVQTVPVTSILWCQWQSLVALPSTIQAVLSTLAQSKPPLIRPVSMTNQTYYREPFMNIVTAQSCQSA